VKSRHWHWSVCSAEVDRVLVDVKVVEDSRNKVYMSRWGERGGCLQGSEFG